MVVVVAVRVAVVVLDCTGPIVVGGCSGGRQLLLLVRRVARVVRTNAWLVLGVLRLEHGVLRARGLLGLMIVEKVRVLLLLLLLLVVEM